MKRLLFTLISLISYSLTSYSQADQYNLKSQNLDKRVVKTITHNYTYDQKSGGFIKQSVSTNTYNDDGNLVESYYSFNSTYTGLTSTTSKLYNYNNKGQLISTQDISPVKSTYSSYYRFFYDNDGNLTKQETHYNNGAITTNEYTYDGRGKLLKKENFSSKRVLTGKTIYEYKGRNRNEIYTSYNTANGSLIGTYTTIYRNDLKVGYKAKSKYSDSNTTYIYDKNNNIIKSFYTDKPESSTINEYEYDNKGNWTINYYKSGNYHSFSFREILFNNGKSTGSTDFNSDYIKRHGNFDNVSVVPIVATKKTTTTTNTNTTTTSSTMPRFSSKNWLFHYVNLDKKVSSLSGEVMLQVTSGSDLSANNTVKISYAFGGKTYGDSYTVSSYTHVKNYHFWSLKSNSKDTKVSLSIYDERQYIKAKDLYLRGLLMITNNGKNSSFYLE